MQVRGLDNAGGEAHTACMNFTPGQSVTSAKFGGEYTVVKFHPIISTIANKRGEQITYPTVALVAR